MLQLLGSKFPTTEFFVTEHNIQAEISGVRVELYDDWSEPFQDVPVEEDGIRMASLKDLAAFKLNTITGRRQKKDYFDLYYLFQVLGTQAALEAFKISSPLLSDKSILFALSEVVTAEQNNSPMPDMLFDISWKEIKESMFQAAKIFMILEGMFIPTRQCPIANG